MVVNVLEPGTTQSGSASFSLVHACLQWQHYYYKPDKTGELIGTPGGNLNGGSTVSCACMHE